ncbi:hypothetical protein HanPSC8_Chr14g0597201 [Helianthus annuus]|nr:hypothetical protein HanPSC8_Chr14g0597201 [Helianthus annuus]
MVYPPRFYANVVCLLIFNPDRIRATERIEGTCNSIRATERIEGTCNSFTRL